MVAIQRVKKYLQQLRFDDLLLNNFLEWPLVVFLPFGRDGTTSVPYTPDTILKASRSCHI